MNKQLNRDSATSARALYDVYQLVMSSPLGTSLLEKLEDIEQQAIKGAFLGDTPENLNTMMERRGDYRTVRKIRNFLTDIEQAGVEAIDWLAHDSASRNGAKDD